MDTLFHQTEKIEKTATNAVGIIIAIAILTSQQLLISAKDIGIGNYTGLSPGLATLIEKQTLIEKKFEKEINSKYFGSKIVEVEKGIKHVRMIRYFNNKPVRINIIELSKNVNNNIDVFPAIASTTLASRSKISDIANNTNAIAAINGGYFKPQTGVPLGTLMINKKVYTGPIYDRVALGIFEENYEMARVKLKASVNTNIGELKIDNVNQPRMLSTHTIVYTRDWGEISPPTPKYGAQLVVSDNKILKISQERVKIPENGFVIIAPLKKIETISQAKKS